MRQPLIHLGKSPLILVPHFIDAELIAPTAKVQGLVGWKLIRGGKVIRDSGGLSPNLIVDTGLDSLGSITALTAFITYMNVGTGSTVPANTQTALVAEIGTARQTGGGAVSAYVAGTNDYWYERMTYSFTELFANGNLTEVALFQNGAGAPMFMRQLLKDNTGTPTTITKTNLDQLQITYEWRWYFPTADDVTSITFSGVTYTVTTRVQGVTGMTNIIWLGPNSNAGSTSVAETNVLVARNATVGSYIDSDSNSVSAYTNGNYYREYQSIYNIGSANFATGIGMLLHFKVYNNYGMFQSSFSPKIAKTNTKKLTLNTRRYWSRYP